MNQNNENCKCTKKSQWLICLLIIVSLITTPLVNYLVVRKQNEILLKKIKGKDNDDSFGEYGD
jgi:hypothetical protein